MDVVIKKEECIKAINKEGLMFGMFFERDANRSQMAYMKNDQEKIDYMKAAIKNCKVCAVGSIIKHIFDPDWLANYSLKKKIHPTIFSPSDQMSILSTMASDICKNACSVENNITKNQEIQQQLNGSNYLGALSMYFESLPEDGEDIDPDHIKFELEQFILREFPDEFTVHVDDIV